MTASEIQYLIDVSAVLSEYSSQLVIREQGNIDDFRFKEIIKLVLLQAYVEVMSAYFNTSIEGDSNFFTKLEIEDVMQRINNITKENLWVNLT